MCKESIAPKNTTVTANNTNVSNVSSLTTVLKPTSPLSRKEVLSKSNPKTLNLIIIHDKVYDVTRWQSHHPGGSLTLTALSGKDATESFMATHDPKTVTMNLLKRFYYADLAPKDCKVDRITQDFRELTRQMKEANMFETDYTFYYKKLAVYFGLFACVVYGVTQSEELCVHALCGIMLGVFWQQMAFIGHDLGHNGVTHDRIKDSTLGFLLGNLLTGIGIGWWKRGHNVHHIVTNSIEYDPDIQHLPVFAVDEFYLQNRVFSTWYNQYLALSNLAHALVKFQHFLFYPIMAFARFNLYAQSLLHVLGVGVYDNSEKIYKRNLQTLSLMGFWAWLITLTLQMDTWKSRIVFFILAHNAAGILHVQICLSHFAQPTYTGVTYDDPSTNGYLQTQLEGSLDIDCPTSMDWFHGGLQFQTVHHIWPRLPRHNLRKAQELLMSFVKNHEGLNYYHLNFYDANCKVLGKLKETSKSTKTWNDIFQDGINLVG
eukprot:CAMPEP_0195522042 /NCGR_PEP_ID=MMETSP0794_2-20130614/19922_1 /TAXON_ID=515487 /ORGANISM="Stephanopyxis turris, Strain CCMP 815" /LENGTH=486 /DNA_ID=CAMNT_0040651721 /DNA_START=54 /DNA_END=1514 /DNA_ORIENTATION=+